ncbi:MAG: two-component sensor histidine kinase [Paracoccaceae bacterium]|nr:MAG: two-component sensor histidine kinase [Paracoccaceae bacterium]
MDSQLTAALLEGVPLPLVIIGRDERIVAANAPARDLFGPGTVGRHYILAMRQPTLLDVIEGTLRHGQRGEARMVMTGPSAETTWAVTVSPVTGEGRAGVLCAFRDITEAVQIGQMRRDFVANVSHELRTPLTALLGFIETLRGAARDDPAARDRFLGIMEREAGRMNRLVRDLLSLSRVEAEERVRPSERVDVAAIAASVVTTLRPMADSMGLTLHLTGAAEPAMVMADPDQITQVLHNLLENAVKYGGSGGRVEVRLTHEEREPSLRSPALRIEVQDWGEGIDPIHLPRLTERFYRVDSHRSREKGGTGLGLAIVKHIVNRHRGRFRIDSTPGEGSTFTVLLPQA